MKLAALALVGCGAAIPPLPSQGGPAWHELTTEHFTLWTDSSDARAKQLLRDMEDLRQVVIGIGFRGAAGAGRSFVIALRDDDEVEAFMPGAFAAIASPASSYILQPMILLAAESNKDPDHSITTHELTHTISHAVIRTQPRWFSEGLAEYFQSIQLDRNAGTAEIGRQPTHRGQPMMMTRMTPLREMMACNELNCADAHFYAAAWVLFLYLTNVRGGDLARYEQLLAEGGDAHRAWQEVFGTDIDGLDSAMRHWIVEGSHKILHYNVQLRTWPVSERTLRDADVYAARALLRLQFQERRDDAKRLAAAALALDATHVLARVVLYRIDGKVDVAAARGSARAHADDWRAWWLLAVAVGNGDETNDARARACELVAANPALTPPWQPCR